jgi:hypothetical protein
MVDESGSREQRNSIFGGTASALNGVPSISAVEQLRQDFGLELPASVVPLPSSGRAYPKDHPFSGFDAVEIRGMTAREEDILTNQALLKRGTVISELIRSCLVDNRADPSSLLNGDRNALVVAIRVTGYGPEYDAEIECSECSAKTSQTFNLVEMPIRRLMIEPVADGQNLFEYVLPFSKKTIRFKFLTGRDEEEIAATQEKQRKLALTSGATGAATVTTSLLYSIVSVEGVTDRQKIAGFVRNMMPARDSLALRTYIKENEPGILMKQDVTCGQCGRTEEVSMPMGVKFLWPHAG